MQITAQHAAKKLEAEKAAAAAMATVIAIQADALPPKPGAEVAVDALPPKVLAPRPKTSATISTQTVVLLSVLALLAIALMPFAVLRLSISARLFDGLSPNQHVHHDDLELSLAGNLNVPTAAYHHAPSTAAPETPKLALAALEAAGQVLASDKTLDAVASGAPSRPSASDKTVGAVPSESGSRLPGEAKLVDGLLVRRIAAALH